MTRHPWVSACVSLSPNQASLAMLTIDRLIQQLYVQSALNTEWRDARYQALSRVLSWCGAHSGAWRTRSAPATAGEFTVWPRDLSLSMDAFDVAADTDTPRCARLTPLPAELLADLTPNCEGLQFDYTHRGGGLQSRVLIRFDGQAPVDISEHQRVVGHMIEASSLALHQLLQRDEWLTAMGRASRGPAALVDANGTYYAVTPQFLSLISESFGAQALEAPGLPIPLPLQEGKRVSTARAGPVFLRITPQEPLYLVHARKPRPIDALSPREQQVAHALNEGKTFKRIAQQLKLSSSTVANHTASIYRKLGVFRREELLAVLRGGGQAD